MNFYIKKNSTLPLLKLQVIKNGRTDFHAFMKSLEVSSIFFSMVDVETGIPKINSKPAGFVEKIVSEQNAEPEYYIYYQFTNRDTNKPGRYEAQFLIKSDEGNLILPIEEKLFITIQESFIADDLPYDSCYVSEYPCCLPNSSILVTPTPTPTPTTTPTNTPTPTPTPTNSQITPTPTPTSTSTPTPTPTPTNTSTPTPTPTPTPSSTPNVVLDLWFDITVYSGSIITEIVLNSSSPVPGETIVDFSSFIKLTDSRTLPVTTQFTIPKDGNTDTKTIIIDEDYSLLTDYLELGEINTSVDGVEIHKLIVNVGNDVTYIDPVTPINVTPTPTPTSTSTPTPTPTPTSTTTPTPTPTSTSTPTPTPTPTTTPTSTPAPTPTPSPQGANGIFTGRLSATTITIEDSSSLVFTSTLNAVNTSIALSAITQTYGYILVPETFQQPTQFRNSKTSCDGFVIPVITQGTITIPNINGTNINYIIYRTYNKTSSKLDIWMCE